LINLGLYCLYVIVTCLGVVTSCYFVLRLSFLYKNNIDPVKAIVKEPKKENIIEKQAREQRYRDTIDSRG
jgi:hypothetical protein